MSDARSTASAPALDLRGHSTRHLAIASATWGNLLAQEERSRVMTSRLVRDLERFGAPRAVIDDARIVAADEARHVQVCADVVRALGHEPRVPSVQLAALPTDDDAFARALTDVLVCGFAVAETMSVGGFTAVRKVTREPVARWAYTILARDEVRHGAFGESAARWAMRTWSADRRRALWPSCVAAMESFERRVGGPARPGASVGRSLPLDALGVPPPGVTAAGLLASVPRSVLPRLARLGVLPDTTATRRPRGEPQSRPSRVAPLGDGPGAVGSRSER